MSQLPLKDICVIAQRWEIFIPEGLFLLQSGFWKELKGGTLERKRGDVRTAGTSDAAGLTSGT